MQETNESVVPYQKGNGQMEKHFFKRTLALLAALCLCTGIVTANAEIIFEKDAPIYPAVFEGMPDPAAPMPFLVVNAAEACKTDGESQPALLEIWFIRISVCDAFLVRCNGETMLIDGGNIGNGKALLEFLNRMDLTHVNYLFNTHHHDDHLEMQQFLLMHGFEADEFLTPYARQYPVPAQLQMEALVDERKIPYHTVHDGDKMRLGGEKGALVEFFRWDGSTNANFASMMCKITLKNRSIFFLADVISVAQVALAKDRPDIPWKSDILKLGHHGYSSQCKELLKLIDPEMCVMTNTRLGGKNAYNQMARLKIPLLLTTHGTIYLHTDGENDWRYTQDKSYLKKP